MNAKVKTLTTRTAAAVLGTVLLVGAGCSDSNKSSTSSPTTKAGARSRIPLPLPRPTTKVPPQLPRGPQMPTDTVSLSDLQKQGKADVVR